MDWSARPTGLPADEPATVRAGIVHEGEWLHLPDGRRLSAGRLSTPALGALPVPTPGRPRLREIVADVRELLADPANAGAVFLVASQFNLREMTGPEVTPEDGIARYAFDHTQGPACAIACATDRRAVLGGGLWEMRNGYLMPRDGALAAIAGPIAGREAALRGLLRVGVQEETEVTLPGAGHRVTQDRHEPSR